MTLAADSYCAYSRAGIGRWSASLFIVLAMHGALALLMLSRRVGLEPAVAPPAAVMIDLAPLPAAALPEAPETPPPLPEPAPVAEPELPLPPPEPSPAPRPAVTLPALPPQPRPQPKSRPKPPDHVRPPQREVALPAPMPPAVALPAPSAPASSAPPPRAVAAARANWQAQLLGFLSRHKRYPRPAQEQRQQGTASLRFSVDRQGRVQSFHLDRSSGFPLLDEEVQALIQRAQPLPSPPPEIPGDRIELVVPVEFSLRR